MRVGRIRASRRGDSCTVWVQVSATVGVPLAEEGKITLSGWVRARVALLKGRPLRCFRCLAPGHVQQRCPCPIDRACNCFNCGGPDHIVETCRNRPHCPLCAERRRRADHRPGSANCASVNPRRGPPSPLPSQTRVRGEIRDTETGAASVPGRAEDGVSQGSSPHSPPGKRVRVERPSTSEEPLPQCQPRLRVAGPSGASPAPEVVEEVEMGELTGWEVEGEA